MEEQIRAWILQVMADHPDGMSRGRILDTIQEDIIRQIESLIKEGLLKDEIFLERHHIVKLTEERKAVLTQEPSTTSVTSDN